MIGDHQRIKGYSLLLCEECKTELHFSEYAFLHEMSVVAEAVYNAFKSEKLDYELLGAGKGLHMHWHIFPRRTGDAPKPGPVGQLGNELHNEKYLPDETELEDLRNRLNTELNKLIM